MKKAGPRRVVPCLPPLRGTTPTRARGGTRPRARRAPAPPRAQTIAVLTALAPHLGSVANFALEPLARLWLPPLLLDPSGAEGAGTRVEHGGIPRSVLGSLRAHLEHIRSTLNSPGAPGVQLNGLEFNGAGWGISGASRSKPGAPVDV